MWNRTDDAVPHGVMGAEAVADDPDEEWSISSSSSFADSVFSVSEDESDDEEVAVPEAQEEKEEDTEEEEKNFPWEPLPVDVDSSVIDVGCFLGRHQTLDWPVFCPPVESESMFDARSTQVDDCPATKMHEDVILEIAALVDDLHVEGRDRRRNLLIHLRGLLLSATAHLRPPAGFVEEINFALPTSWRTFQKRLSETRRVVASHANPAQSKARNVLYEERLG